MSVQAPGPVLDRATVLRVAVGVLLLVGLFTALGTLAREPVEAASLAVVGRLGLGGIFLAVAALDPIPVVGFQPLVIVGAAGGLPLLPLFAVAWAGVVVGSAIAWALGALVRDGPRVRRALERARVGDALRQRATLTLTVAAVAPLPYGLAVFGAGAVGAPLRSALAGAAARGLKIALSLGAVALGWSVGG